jgi:micrococcal nuclease
MVIMVYYSPIRIYIFRMEVLTVSRRLLSLLLFLSFVVGTGWLGSTALADHDPPHGIPNDAESATVRAIVDGDTIRITLEDGTKDTVRLIGIDTPETQRPGDPIECYGPEASERIARLLPVGREIWLETDVSDRDRFDRLLRYVWVEKDDGNEVMARDGFAIAKRYTPDTARTERLERAQERAINAGRGLWSACAELVFSMTPTAVPPTAVPPTAIPEPTPDTGFYVAGDGCTYRNVDGNLVSCPVFADQPPAGATARCNDGSWSFSQNRRGTCSHHGGVAYWL